MTTSQSRNLRKAGAVALSLALAMSTLAITPASAAKKVKLAKTKITVNVGKTKTVKIKNVKKKQVKKLTVKSSKATVAKAKASKKTAIKVTGKKAGSAKVTANLKLKKKVGGKKAYKLTLKVTVKKAAPAPVEPTAAPTAAPTPVVSGASISLDKPTGYTCQVKGPAVTVTANLLPATSNEKVDFSIDKPEFAVVSGTSATVNGVATCQIIGLKEGSCNITAKIAAASVTAKVTVEKEQIAAKIVGGKQTKANAVQLDFDIDWKKDNQGFDKGKFDVDVYNAAGQVTKTIPVNKVASSATTPASGSSVELTLDSPFGDNDKVVVNLYKGKDYTSKYEFVASVGAPVGVNIVTKEAQRDLETKIEIALVDKNGIDVTSTVDIDTRVGLTVDGTDCTYNTSPTSNANITMTKNGAIATVTAAYTSATNTTGTPDFQNSGNILCVEPKPTIGDPHFKKYTGEAHKEWGGEDSVAKFYTGTDAKSVEVAVDSEVTYSFYASTQDDAKDAIKYDEYSVSSSNGDIASATVDKTGKYCNITVTGIKAGSCNINVTAKKNTKDAPYIIPVTVKPEGKFVNFAVTAKRSSVSNAFDSTYQKENGFNITAKDDLGNDLKDADGFKIGFELTKPEAAKLEGQKYTQDDDMFQFAQKFALVNEGSTECYYDAAGAAAGSYTVVATAEYKGVEKKSTISISVKQVPKAVFVTGGTDIKYQLDATSTELKLTKDQTSTIRLAAYNGGVFVGYVDNDGKIGDNKRADGTTTPTFATHHTGSFKFFTTAANPTLFNEFGSNGFANKKTKVDKVYTMVQAGTKWGTGHAVANTSNKVQLCNRDTYYQESKFATKQAIATGAVVLSSVSNNAKRVYWVDGKFDTDYAKAGNYTVRVVTQKANTAELNTPVDKSIKVTDDLFKPTVTVENRTLTDYNEDGVKEALKCNVDLNSNDSNNASILNVYAKYDKGLVTPTFENKQQSIGYVSVDEGGIIYYVALGAAFNQKA